MDYAASTQQTLINAPRKHRVCDTLGGRVCQPSGPPSGAVSWDAPVSYDTSRCRPSIRLTARAARVQSATQMFANLVPLPASVLGSREGRRTEGTFQVRNRRGIVRQATTSAIPTAVPVPSLGILLGRPEHTR